MRYLSNVTSLEYEAARCTGCGRCVEVCPHGVFSLNGRKAVLADKNLCMECGACSRNCEPQAIQVRPGVGCAWAILRSQWRKGKGDQAACCCD
jgi:NAD-dependent dihydropyrimidine dehydrogenase PreA subunit